jgi:ABC-type arginine/histidine transport system permease subunit
MLIQLFLIYYGLAQFKSIRGSSLWPFLREGYWCCLLAFTLNTAAYTIEIIAGAIRNVPHADIETAYAMGMSRGQVMLRITMPIAVRIFFPSYTNEVIFILQSTSLASMVTVLDLTGVARVIIARTFSPYEFFITIGLIYLALTYLTLALFRRFEGYLYRYQKSHSAAFDDVGLR